MSVPQLRLAHLAGAHRYPRAVLPVVQVNFPVKHHHETNSAALPCCLWKHRHPSQTSPRQAQHAPKRGESVSLGKRQAGFTELLSSSSPGASCGPSARAEPGWGHRQPRGQQPPLGWHWHSARGPRGQTAMSAAPSMALAPPALALPQGPPQCHFRAKTI